MLILKLNKRAASSFRSEIVIRLRALNPQHAWTPIMFARSLLQQVVVVVAGQPASAVGRRALGAAATAGTRADLGSSSCACPPSTTEAGSTSSSLGSTSGSGGISSGSSMASPWRAAHQHTQRAGMFVVVTVRNNNVDAAYGRLNRHCQENGLYTELRKRDHREPNHELAFQVRSTCLRMVR